MKLNYKRIFFLGLAFLSISSFWQLYDNVVPLILENTFLLNPDIAGVIMAMDNVVALIMLPLFGMFSDRTRTRFGKRTPFIVIGTIIATASMIFMPIADNQKNLTLFITALAIVLLAMATYRSPAVALMPDLTPKPLRSKANAVINLMGAAGGILTLLLIKLLVDGNTDRKANYIYVFAAVAILMFVAVVVLLITIRENKMANEAKEMEKLFQTDIKQEEIVETNKKLDPKVKKSLIFLLLAIFLWFTAYNAVTTAFSRYVQNVWKLGNTGFTNFLMVAMGAAIISFLPIGIISSKIGRKKTILIGITLITLSYFMGCFFTHYHPLIYLVFIMTGFGWASINVNSYPMVVEMSKGSDVGKYTGYYYSFSMAAQIVTPILSGFLMTYMSYSILFPYAFIFSIASFVMMWNVKHGDSKPMKKTSAIEHFDVED